MVLARVRQKLMYKKKRVTFKDVAGQDEAKESLQEVVDFLHNPENIPRLVRNFQRGHAGRTSGNR